MTAWARREAFEASLSDEERWQVESGRAPLATPTDFGSEDDDNEEERDGR